MRWIVKIILFLYIYFYKSIHLIYYIKKHHFKDGIISPEVVRFKLFNHLLILII